MIHQYKNNGYNIVMDINSGSIHSVDDLAYDIISLYEEKTKAEISAKMLEKYKGDPEINQEEIEEVFRDIEELKKQNKLFSKDIFAPRGDTFKKRQGVLKALCLHIAHDCNLACKYCFAGEGEYQGDRSLMSFETGKKALDFLIKNSGSRKNLEVDFFGGEPLMNFETVKKLVAYGRKQEALYNKNFRFTLTTNGILLDDEIIEFANQEMSNLVLSLDGRKEINDNLRVTKNGRGSYEIILPKFIKAAQSRGQKDYYIRGTYTHYNLDFSEDILHMADLGFKEISMEPVVAPPDAPYSLTQEDVPILCNEYQRLAEEMLKREEMGQGFNFFHFTIDLDGGPCIIKRISGCGVGSEYLAVTPWGDLYPCHQFVGNKDFLLGNLDEGIVNHELKEEFSSCNIYSRKECGDCFARLYCSGGCAANAYHSCGSIKAIYDIGCKLHRKRIECAIMLEVARAGKKAKSPA